MLRTTETTLEMTRELTDCRIFGTLTGAVGGSDTRQHAQQKLFLADVMEEAPGPK
jgi:hypothetical protein